MTALDEDLVRQLEQTLLVINAGFFTKPINRLA